MDQIKIGKFIAEKRKEQGLTQLQLAEKLGITDRAVSKWETGKSLPDASVMLALCEILHITVNDLLNGEVVSMENYDKEMEKTLLAMVRQKEEADKRMLSFEIIFGVISGVVLLVMLGIGAWLSQTLDAHWIGYVLIGIGLGQFLIVTVFALRIEQVAGYYECAKCGHKYEPTYARVSMAMHVGRTRYMKCPHCGKWSWQKKVIRND